MEEGGNFATKWNVQMEPFKEGCAEGIEQRPNHAVLKDAEIKFKVEECA